MINRCCYSKSLNNDYSETDIKLQEGEFFLAVSSAYFLREKFMVPVIKNINKDSSLEKVDILINKMDDIFTKIIFASITFLLLKHFAQVKKLLQIENLKEFIFFMEENVGNYMSFWI